MAGSENPYPSEHADLLPFTFQPFTAPTGAPRLLLPLWPLNAPSSHPLRRLAYGAVVLTFTRKNRVPVSGGRVMRRDSVVVPVDRI